MTPAEIKVASLVEARVISYNGDVPVVSDVVDVLLHRRTINGTADLKWCDQTFDRLVADGINPVKAFRLVLSDDPDAAAWRTLNGG